MTVVRESRVLPLFRHVENEQGEIIEVTRTGETVIETVDLLAENGKVIKHKASGKIVGTHVSLGTSDHISNYIEVDKVENTDEPNSEAAESGEEDTVEDDTTEETE